MKFTSKRKILWLIVGITVASLLFVWGVNYKVHSVSQDYIYSDVSEVPSADTALILGALVYTNGEMSPMLSDRVATAVKLYEAQKVEHILVSGDHSRVEYDEVNIIKNHLLDLGVLAEDIFLDHAGLDTYDSLYRARDIFQVESLIVVSQNFHLGRAVYIAKGLGIEAYGLSADMQEYYGIEKYELRELFANVKAFMNLLFNTAPKYLGDPIPISGSSFESWDEKSNEFSIGSIRDIVAINNDAILVLADVNLLGISQTDMTSEQIYQFKTESIGYTLSNSLDKALFYTYSKTGEEELFILDLNNFSKDLTSGTSNLLEEESNYNEEISHSKKQSASGDSCNGVDCLLSIKKEDGQSILVEGTTGFSQLLWSPTDQYLAYNAETNGGFGFIKVFDTLNDAPAEVDLENSEYATYISHSTSISNKIYDQTGVIPYDQMGNIVTWLDANTLLLKTNLTADKNTQSIFWEYNMDDDELTKIAQTIVTTEEWEIEDAKLSRDLTKIAFIKNGNNEKQELWVANADGTDAKLIYKNY